MQFNKIICFFYQKQIKKLKYTSFFIYISLATIKSFINLKINKTIILITNAKARLFYKKNKEIKLVKFTNNLAYISNQPFFPKIFLLTLFELEGFLSLRINTSFFSPILCKMRVFFYKHQVFQQFILNFSSFLTNFY